MADPNSAMRPSLSPFPKGMNGTSANCLGTETGPHPSVLSSTSGSLKPTILLLKCTPAARGNTAMSSQKLERSLLEFKMYAVRPLGAQNKRLRPSQTQKLAAKTFFRSQNHFRLLACKYSLFPASGGNALYS